MCRYKSYKSLHRWRRICIIIGVFGAVASVISADSAATRPFLKGDDLPFTIGETMEHSIRVPMLLGAQLATMRTTLLGYTNIRGHTCYKAVAEVVGKPVLRSVFNYHIYNITYEYFDTTTFEELKIITIVTEADYHNYVEIDIDTESHTYTYRDVNTNVNGIYHSVMSGMISMLYSSRVLRLHDGDTLECALFNDMTVEYVTSVVSHGERVTVPAFDNQFVNIIKIERMNLLANICLSDDKHRLPVFMVSTPIPVSGIGSVSLYMRLENYWTPNPD